MYYFLGIIAGVMLFAAFSSNIDTSSDSVILDKIEIIQQANNSSDSAIIEQGEDAKIELAYLRNQKKLATKMDAEKEQARNNLKNEPPSFLKFLVFSFLLFGSVAVTFAVFRFSHNALGRL